LIPNTAGSLPVLTLLYCYPLHGALGLKFVTHVIVGAGVAAFVAAYMGCSIGCVAVSIAAGAAAQGLVDQFGHESVGVIPRRIAVTHSPDGATILSLLLWVGTAIVFYQVGVLTSLADVLVMGLAVWLAVMSHLILDLVTEGGIYVSLRSNRRVKLFGFPYNNVMANRMAQFIGMALLMAAMAKVASMPLFQLP
jgi:hypothetical protein